MFFSLRSFCRLQSYSLRSYRLPSWNWIAILLLFPWTAVYCQPPTCPTVADRAATPADTAFGDGRYADAEGLYRQTLQQKPQDAELSAALVRVLLHEDKVAEAFTQANAALGANPHAAAALTALAEVQLRQGQPWLAMETLDSAVAADACYARAHLIRGRVFRIDSMYASERAEIKLANEINPSDPDIQHDSLRILSPANDIEGTANALATTKDVDAETRQKAEATMHSLLPLLSENSQTCKVLPSMASATIPLQPSFADVKHIDGYRLEADLPKNKAKLIVDSAASGLYISKTLSEQNGFQHGAEDPPGTVRVDSVHIGPLEFHDCIVGVSDMAFAGKADGFIGTDMFAPWLVTLEFRSAKLILEPLPEKPGIIPGDRLASPELAGYTPVYHRRQYLLVPLTFGNKSRKLFTLATGMRFSAMTSETAHALSKMTVNFTNTEQTAQGTKVQFYREIFDMQFGSLAQIHQGHILELDPSVMNRNAGFEIAGMLGLDVLQPLTLHLDYRDGLVKFESTDAGIKPLFGRGTMVASDASSPANSPDQPRCRPRDTIDRPLNQTLQAKLTGGLDSAHLKPGQKVWARVLAGLDYPGCSLDQDAVLYGHVTASAKDSGAPELSLVFDHGDCTGNQNKELPLRLIGLVAPPDESRRMHGEIPVELAGRGQQIGGSKNGTDAVTALNGMDENLNPGGPPHTVHPGIVVNMPAVKLDPEGGPECSAKITSTSRSVTLGTGSELIFTMSAIAE